MVGLFQALGRGQFFVRQPGQFLLLGSRSIQVSLCFRQFNLGIRDLGGGQALLNLQHRLRGQAKFGQGLPGRHAFSGGHQHRGDDRLEGQVHQAFKGAKDLAVKADLGFRGGNRRGRSRSRGRGLRLLSPLFFGQGRNSGQDGQGQDRRPD